MQKIYDWLLQGDPVIKFLTQADLVNQQILDININNLKKKIKEYEPVNKIIIELKKWPGTPLKNHKDAKHLIHKLVFIADLGFTIEDDDIMQICNLILKYQSNEGPFQILGNISSRFGGSGTDELAWMMCDAPLIVYSLLKFGIKKNKKLEKALDFLFSISENNGWGCKVSEKYGNFRGPGKKTDPCPYVNLLMLKLITAIPKFKECYFSKNSIETIITLWFNRSSLKPYLFGMGTDFSKLKAPFIWYDILFVADVLSQFETLKKDRRLLEMIDIIKSKKDENGLFRPESIYLSWKEWDFGQKKEPSRWITFFVYRILKRLGKKIS